MIYPLVRELAEGGIPVTVTCRVLNMARQAYYRWLVDPVSESQMLQAHRANALVDAHGSDPEYGYRLLRDEAETNGWVMSRRTAWRLASALNLASVTVRRRRGSGKTPGPAVADDLVQRQFQAAGPNQLWLTDITEHPTNEGKLYLCAVKDGRFLMSQRVCSNDGEQKFGRLPNPIVARWIQPTGANRCGTGGTGGA